jgi:hypothetical protein
MALPTSIVFGPPGFILPMRYISRSEATTAIMPAIGAIQKTRGLSYMNVSVCKGMYMLNYGLPFCLYIFPLLEDDNEWKPGV